VHPIRTLSVVAVLVAILTPFGPAAAGGPTSALLSVPGEGTTASLYYTDPEYDALAGLVGIESGAGVGTVDESGGSHEYGPGVTVTWLIHDVEPWRVDRIYLEGEGAPWIATQLFGGSGPNPDASVVWHQPKAGSKLAALLDQLGVGEAARGAGDFTGVGGAPVPAPPEPTAEESAPAEPSVDRSSLASIWWALGGLACGVLATVLWRRPRGKPAGTEKPPTTDATGEPGVAVTEQVAWPATRA
jgi:hypothetical protein